MAKSTETNETAEAPQSTGKKHLVAKFVGGIYTRRIISKKDQDKLIGVSGIATEDLIWEKGGNAKVDITNAHEEVIAYLRKDDSFRVSEVEAPSAS